MHLWQSFLLLIEKTEVFSSIKHNVKDIVQQLLQSLHYWFSILNYWQETIYEKAQNATRHIFFLQNAPLFLSI